MARYLYRCSDGAPYGYIDEEGGTDAMLYTLDGRWLGYVSADGGNVFSPSGQPVFYIADNYFCDASGPVLYCEKKGSRKDATGDVRELVAMLRDDWHRAD
jgi:hypothetical protein